MEEFVTLRVGQKVSHYPCSLLLQWFTAHIAAVHVVDYRVDSTRYLSAIGKRPDYGDADTLKSISL
jgi:hypothetical protein